MLKLHFELSDSVDPAFISVVYITKYLHGFYLRICECLIIGGVHVSIAYSSGGCPLGGPI